MRTQALASLPTCIRRATLAALMPFAAFGAEPDSLVHTAATVHISSEPDAAQVFFDGSSRGLTPLVLTGVEPGTHTLRLVAGDPGNWFSDVVRDTVVIPEGSTQDLHYRLERRIAIITNPSGADVVIGDSLAGVTPLTVPFEAVRRGGVRVRKPGYQEYPITLPPAGSSAAVVPLATEAAMRPEQHELVENGSNPNLPRILIASGCLVVSGATSAYFKASADEKNARFLATGDPGLRSQRDRHDVIAAVSLVATQVSVVLLISFLLAE